MKFRMIAVVGIIMAVLAIGVVLRLAQTMDAPQEAIGGAGGWARDELAPQSMSEWVARADLIVYGTILDVQNVGLFSGWGDDGSVATVTPNAGVDDPFASTTAPLYEVVVHVETVYKDVASGVSPGETILLRHAGLFGFFWGEECPDWIPDLKNPYDSAGSTSGHVGESYLFALAEHPDGDSWGPPTADLGQLSMIGPEVMTSGCPPAKIEFTENVAPAVFIAEMLEAIDAE